MLASLAGGQQNINKLQHLQVFESQYRIIVEHQGFEFCHPQVPYRNSLLVLVHIYFKHLVLAHVHDFNIQLGKYFLVLAHVVKIPLVNVLRDRSSLDDLVTVDRSQLKDL